MAFRKEKIKEQFGAAIAPALEPGEQVRAGVFCQSGPTPWLTGAIGIWLMLLMGMRYYFIAVSDRRMLFFRGSLWTVRPKGGLEWADPLGAGQVTDVEATAKLWSHFKYQRPGVEKPIRFNVHRIWRTELQEVVGAMAQPPAPAIPPTPPIPPPMPTS